MKRLLAMLLAGLLLITSMSVIAWADNDESDIDTDEPVGALPGPIFYSYSDLFKYIEGLDEKYVSSSSWKGYSNSIYSYLYYNMDGIYIPDLVKINEVRSVYIDRNYVQTGFNHCDELLSLNAFVVEKDGESYTERFVNMAKNSGVVTTLDNGTDVYFCRYIGAGCYVFVQDGVYYQLMNWSDPAYDETMLEYCNASYHYFSEVFELAAEAADDSKVRLSWDELGEDESYIVYWKRSSSDEWKVAGTISKNKVNITGLKSGASYDFKIEASNVESEVVTITAD